VVDLVPLGVIPTGTDFSHYRYHVIILLKGSRKRHGKQGGLWLWKCPTL